MEVYSTEEEQIAAIKKWWKDNWLSLFGGVLIGIGILAGGKYWLDTKNFHAESASVEYEAMIQSLTRNQLEEASNRAATLLGQYADTPYAGLAALTMAKIKTDKDDLVTAKSHLRWAMDNVQQKGTNTLIFLVGLQFLLGVLTILFINKAKVLLGVSHQIGAFFLLTAMTFVLHRFSK